MLRGGMLRCHGGLSTAGAHRFWFRCRPVQSALSRASAGCLSGQRLGTVNVMV